MHALLHTWTLENRVEGKVDIVFARPACDLAVDAIRLLVRFSSERH
jgi:hypothetical protein